MCSDLSKCGPGMSVWVYLPANAADCCPKPKTSEAINIFANCSTPVAPRFSKACGEHTELIHSPASVQPFSSTEDQMAEKLSAQLNPNEAALPGTSFLACSGKADDASQPCHRADILTCAFCNSESKMTLYAHMTYEYLLL